MLWGGGGAPLQPELLRREGQYEHGCCQRPGFQPLAVILNLSEPQFPSGKWGVFPAPATGQPAPFADLSAPAVGGSAHAPESRVRRGRLCPTRGAILGEVSEGTSLA